MKLKFMQIPKGLHWWEMEWVVETASFRPLLAHDGYWQAKGECAKPPRVYIEARLKKLK